MKQKIMAIIAIAIISVIVGTIIIIAADSPQQPLPTQPTASTPTPPENYTNQVEARKIFNFSATYSLQAGDYSPNITLGNYGGNITFDYIQKKIYLSYGEVYSYNGHTPLDMGYKAWQISSTGISYMFEGNATAIQNNGYDNGNDFGFYVSTNSIVDMYLNGKVYHTQISGQDNIGYSDTNDTTAIIYSQQFQFRNPTNQTITVSVTLTGFEDIPYNAVYVKSG